MTPGGEVFLLIYGNKCRLCFTGIKQPDGEIIAISR